MIELPEALALARQMRDAYLGRVIVEAEANRAPHKFAFYTGDPSTYDARLAGRAIVDVKATGPYVELVLSDGMTLLLREGVNARRLAPGAKAPAKHQLLLSFDDGSKLVCTAAMYGMFLIADTGADDDEYYVAARDAVPVLSDAFDEAAFRALVDAAPSATSVKALLATEQRIPGVGNGVLQDILLNARLNPKRKAKSLADDEVARLFRALKDTLAAMAREGGRNVEKDLYGEPGGYRCLLSAKTWKDGCPVCHGAVVRQPYLGGNVYYCPACQPLA